MKHIFCDMDNTIADFSTGYFQWFATHYLGRDNPEYKRLFKIRREDNDTYEIYKYHSDIWKDVRISQAATATKDADTFAKKIMHEIFAEEDFWKYLPPMDNAWHTLEAIQNELGNKIIITTKPWWSKECMSAKLWWLEKYMPFLDVYSQVIFLSDKSMLNNNNIIIDDCPDHLEGYGGIKIKAEWPYNKSCDCDYSFTDWTNVYSFVQEINSEEK